MRRPIPIRLIPLLPFLFLAACGPTGTTLPPRVAPPPPASGLDGVTGRNVPELRKLFGEPDLDVREGTARKLQFASGICVLDAYLYPSAPGREPQVSYIDTRRPDGTDFDRASCIAALSRRKEAR